MKISTLIKRLEAIKKKHGDIGVVCWPYDGQDRDFPLKKVEVFECDGKMIVGVDV